MIAILMIALFESMGSGLIIPILPGLVGRVVGLSEYEQGFYYGLVLASSLIMMFLFSQFFGRLSDRYGRRPLILGTMAGIIGAYIVMSQADTLWVLFLAQAIVGFCAASGSVGRAYIAEIASPENRAQSYAYISGAIGVGFVLGPVMGGYLGAIDTHLPFYVAAGMTVITLIFAFFALSESLDPEDQREFSWRSAMPFASVPAFLNSTPLARGVIIVSLIEAFAISVPYEAGALILFMQKSLHWTSEQVGLWLTVLAASAALGSGIMTPIVIRLFGDRRAWLIGIVATIFVFIAAGFITHGWQMYCLIVVYATVSFVGPVALAIVSRSVPGNQLGEVHGAFISLSSVIKAVAIFIGTWVYSYFTGPLAPFQLAGAVFFLGALVQIPAVIYGVIILRRTRAVSESESDGTLGGSVGAG
jgi:DHA1 family tetracycline resistance protein-like MFS transporter